MKILALALPALVIALGTAPDAAAFHQTSPPVTALTVDGDTDLPRIPCQGRRAMSLIVDADTAPRVVELQPFKTGSAQTEIFAGGDNGTPATSFNGRVHAWRTDDDPLGGGAPGYQVIFSKKGIMTQAALDETGTSANPTLDKAGKTLAFESTGDLAGIGNTGARQIFLRDRKGFIRQLSSGDGTSQRPMMSAKGKGIVYDSTSDPVTGDDTGVSQIWTGRWDSLEISRITDGAGHSRNATISDKGRLVAFESEADLADTGDDTGIPQIFIYDTRSETYAQLTDDPAGCTKPVIAKIQRDWRITFVCSQEAHYFMLRADERYRVQTDGGTVQSIFPEMGVHFVQISTTADLITGGGPTPGHLIYQVNLLARPAELLPGSATWFPHQGISPL